MRKLLIIILLIPIYLISNGQDKTVKIPEKETPSSPNTCIIKITADKNIVEEIKSEYQLNTNVEVAYYIYKYFLINELGKDE